MQPRLGSLVLRNENFLFLPTILLLLNVIDVATSSYGLSIGLREINPLFSLSVTVLTGKFLGCGMLFVSSYLQYKFYPNAKIYMATVLYALIFVYLLGTANNLVLILKVVGTY
jgi:Domain of unknown function (DUF5658)